MYEHDARIPADLTYTPPHTASVVYYLVLFSPHTARTQLRTEPANHVTSIPGKCENCSCTESLLTNYN